MLAPLAAVLLGVLASAATALAAEPAVVAPGRVALFEGGANTVAAMADGRALLAGGSGDSLVVVRLGAGGTPDPTFGAGGTVRLRLPELERIVQLLAQPDGGVVVIAGGRSTGTCFETPVAVVRLTAAGTLDGTFGEHGVATPKIGAYCFPRPAAALAADGSIVIAGSTGVYDRDLKPAVAKLTPAGRLDERFGGDGIVELPSGGLVNTAASTAAIAPGGRIVVIYPDHLAALTAGGVLDPAFHHGAPVSLAGCELVVARPDGSIDALVTAARSKRISRVTSAGVLDRAFGAGGTVRLATHDGDSPLRLFVAADGATTL
ncbi:MAG: large repetitive protein, partial [bacterium]